MKLINRRTIILFVAIICIVFVFMRSKRKHTVVMSRYDVKSNALVSKYKSKNHNIHVELMNLLETFEKTCTSAGIIYFATAGTLLGAARNRAIIPWDDDIDVGILYKDMHALIRVIPPGYHVTFIEIPGWREKKKTNNIGIMKFKRDGSPYFIDVFFYVLKGNRFQYHKRELLETWNEGYFLKGEMFPLRRFQFGKTFIWGPHEYVPYLNRMYGIDWNEKYVISHRHFQ